MNKSVCAPGYKEVQNPYLFMSAPCFSHNTVFVSPNAAHAVLHFTVNWESRAHGWGAELCRAGPPPLLPHQFTWCVSRPWYAQDLLFLHDGRDSALSYVPHPSYCCCFRAASERAEEEDSDRPTHTCTMRIVSRSKNTERLNTEQTAFRIL